MFDVIPVVICVMPVMSGGDTWGDACDVWGDTCYVWNDTSDYCVAPVMCGM